MRLNIPNPRDIKLNHVQIHGLDRPLCGTFPDFLVLGPQRTGTTWMATQLRRNPKVRLAWPKELRYFSRLSSTGSEHSRYHSLVRSPGSAQGVKDYLKKAFKAFYFDGYVRHRYSSQELEWYLSFFAPHLANRLVEYMAREGAFSEGDVLVGEATPAYAHSPASIIEDIVTLNPDIRGILIVRDPVERAWSHAKLDWFHGKKDPSIMLRDMNGGSTIDQGLKDFLCKDYQVRCGQYSRMVENWGGALKPNNLLLVSFDELFRNPASVLGSVLAFLKLDPKDTDYGDLAQKINSHGAGAPPANVRRLLESQFASEREWIKSKLGDRWASGVIQWQSS